MCVTKDGFMSLKTTTATIVAKWCRQLSENGYKPEFKNLNDYFCIAKGTENLYSCHRKHKLNCMEPCIKQN